MGTIIFVSALILAIFILDIIVFVRSKKEKSLLSPIAMVILLLILLFTMFLEYRGSELTSGEWSQTLLMIGLVSLTAFYAISTEKQAKASVEMAKEMSKTRYDTARPVIDIRFGMSANDLIERGLADTANIIFKGLVCELVNVGCGPALDVHSHIKDTTTSDSKEYNYDFGVIVVGEHSKKLNCAVHEDNKVLYFEVQYRDIYGRLFKSKKELNQEAGSWVLGSLQTSVTKGVNHD